MGAAHCRQQHCVGLSWSSPCTGKGTGPGCFAVASGLLVPGWRKEGAPSKISLHPPRETPRLFPPALLQSCSPPHPNLASRPGTPGRLQLSLHCAQKEPADHIFPATFSPVLGARVCLAGLCPMPAWALRREAELAQACPS